MTELEERRQRMVEHQIARRGIRGERLLQAFRDVPREEFLPETLLEFAYEDRPLPIDNGQTISQPYIVALTIQSLRLTGQERVLEVGTGSGYAAAIIGRVANEVFSIERIEGLAQSAKARLARLGYTNVHVTCGDGSLGWREHAPYDAIAVAAGGPRPPPSLLAQLAIGGRLVIPVGADEASQVLVCITRESESKYVHHEISDVRFVPLIGDEAWQEDLPRITTPPREPRTGALPVLIREAAEPIGSIDGCNLDSLLDRIGDSNVVLLGEATHGTSEFCRMRARITRELIERKGFRFVAVEADWPDAARVHDHVLGERRSNANMTPFTRFPAWMWRNEEVHDFVDWLRATNKGRERKVGFHGLDLYSLFTSIDAVLAYLDKVDPSAAGVARHRYGALTPWQKDPAAYGKAVLVGKYASSESAVVATLRDMLAHRLDYSLRDGDLFFDAAQNARLVADAERYYRAIYYGAAASWNLRDAHMFDTLRSLLAFYGADAKAIVWEHNSHVGDARATEMSARGEENLGQMCRGLFGDRAYIVGFGTDHGSVAAASDWGEPVEKKRVTPAIQGSYERLFHEAGIPAFALHLRNPSRKNVRDDLASPLLERAIGVVYRPETERQSHYFEAVLPQQFDEYIWFDETMSVQPLPAAPQGNRSELPDTYPFGL